MEFQTPIRKDSFLIKLINDKIKWFKVGIENPLRLLGSYDPHHITLKQINEAVEGAVINLNECEKLIDLIEEHRQRNSDVGINDIEVIDAAHVTADNFGMPNPQQEK